MTNTTVYYAAASLDGYIATPDGGVDWLEPFNVPGEDYGYADFYASVDSLLMGRATYEKVLTLAEQNPYAGKPLWVMSKSGLPEPWDDVEITGGSPEAVLNHIGKAGCKRTWLVGGAALAASFAEQGFLDEIIITTIPVLLGQGIAMFSGQLLDTRLRLLESRPYKNGVVQNTYTTLQ